MRDSLRQHFSIAIHIGILIVTICVGVLVVHQNEKEARNSIVNSLSLHEKEIVELAQITDRNGADVETAYIISDCPRRSDYEGYLVRLASLSKQELITMQNLFEGCSPFFVEQKQLMVFKLEKELESYTNYLSLLKSFQDTTEYDSRFKDFTALVTLEKERALLLVDQTNIQGDIINFLISGKSPQGAEVSNLLSEAQQIKELLDVLDLRVDEIRTGLTK